MSSAVMEHADGTAISTGSSRIAQGKTGDCAPSQNDSAVAEERRGASNTDRRVGKYLTFLLGREEFAIRVLQVREIMGLQDITSVPQTPAYVKGVINLRGKIIPVVDLRLKFSLAPQEYSERTCIIVVQVASCGITIQTGIVVDEVSEVLTLTASDIEDTPDFGEGTNASTSYLLGMAKVKGKVKILLDIDQVLSGQEVHGLQGLMHLQQ